MKIGVISDTHDQANLIEKAVLLLNEEQIELLVHCGDWVSPFILYSFKGLKAPIKGVFGNNDGDKFRHLTYSHQFGLDIHYEDRFLELNCEGRIIAIFHGDYPQLVDALVTCGKYDAVFHGHTHQRVCKKQGETLSLNPGSLMCRTMGNSYGASFAIYETATNQAAHVIL